MNRIFVAGFFLLMLGLWVVGTSQGAGNLTPLTGAGGKIHTAGGSSWTPASIGASLLIWLKADVGITPTGSCTPNACVGTWADQSGNSHNGTGWFQYGNQPQYSSTTWKGSNYGVQLQPGIYGGGAIDFSAITTGSVSTFSSCMTIQSNYSDANNLGMYPYLWAARDTANGQVYNGAGSFGANTTTTTSGSVIAMNGGMLTSPSGSGYTVPSNGTYVTVCYTNDGSTVTTYVNGTSYYTATANTALGSSGGTLAFALMNEDANDTTSYPGIVTEWFFATSNPASLVSNYDTYSTSRWGTP